MSIEYKMHLFTPRSNVLTLCGRKLRSFSTHDPLVVTCKQCLGSYVGNVAWYWKMREMEMPKMRLFLNADEPFPELVVIHRPTAYGAKPYNEVIYLQLSGEKY